MVRYFTSRESAEKLGVNLAKWKRWAREFLPPDPLGGMQSGYARQYLTKDVFIVVLGGHLVSHLKFSVPEAKSILTDLNSWLKKNDFYNNIENNGTPLYEDKDDPSIYRIYIKIKKHKKNGPAIYRYLVRKIVLSHQPEEKKNRVQCEYFEEIPINMDPDEVRDFFNSAFIRLLNISALYSQFKEKLN